MHTVQHFMQVNNSLKVGERRWVAEKTLEGVCCYDNTCHVQTNASQAHQGAKQFQPVAKATKVLPALLNRSDDGIREEVEPTQQQKDLINRISTLCSLLIGIHTLGYWCDPTSHLTS